MKRVYYCLKRVVGNKTRYYKLSLNINLFGECVLSKTFGSCANASPTRVIDEYYNSFDDAMLELMKTLTMKNKKGYMEAISDL